MKKNFLSMMLDALTSAYSRKDCCHNNPNQVIETNIGKLFAVLAWGLESVKEQAELIQLWDDIDNAKGAVLDRYGANFGVKRISPNDSFYRLAIKVKMMALLSGGDTDTVIQTVSALLDVDPQKIDFEDIYPAKIAVYVDDENIPKEYKNLVEPIAQTIKRILSAGVGIRLYLRRKSEYRQEIKIARYSFGTVGNTAHPVSNDREHENTVNSVSGVLCHTHIKSRRIE